MAAPRGRSTTAKGAPRGRRGRTADSLIAIDRRLAAAVDALEFAPPVAYVYDPLVYARTPHEAYLSRFGAGPCEAVFVGMNPGPYGMAQTGVPFGDPGLVRDWMGIDGPVEQPPAVHPKRPILGFASTRTEVSGSRLWGWARNRFGPPEAFFERFFVLNYCPLVFMEESGRNRVPEKLPRAEREPLFAACDRALAESVAALAPRLVVGVGKFAEERARKVLEGPVFEAVRGATPLPKIGRVLHPSPASPLANKGWTEPAEDALRGLGISL